MQNTDSAFAVIETGGKQYKVSSGTLIEVEKTGKEKGETLEAKIIALSRNGEFLFQESQLGSAKAELEVLDHGRDDKVLIFKRKRRKNSQKMNGHRQHFDLVRVSLS